MKQPILFSVDDDPQVLRAVTRDLKNRFRQEYRVLSTTSAQEALDSLIELKNKGEVVALFLSDQRMPEMLGVEFLEKAKTFYPEAKRVLLTAYSDTDAAIKAINDVRLDYYLMKPWDPPEEKFYPVMHDLLEEWQSQVIPDFAGMRLIGYQFSPQAHKIKDFLSGNLLPYQWLDAALAPQAQELMELNQIKPEHLPVLFFEDGSFLSQPELPAIAARIGLNPKASSELYDVVIIGAGPAGLGAAVYGASEGLKTALIEKRAPGGQAGTSSRIENYLGFPTGLSGSDLARRAITQATRFGTEFLAPQEVMQIEVEGPYKILYLADGSKISSKAVVITTGVSYRQLETPGLSSFTGAGVYYGAANTEAHACKEKDIYVVGGGNSAGQAAMYLSQFAKHVYIVIRKPDLTATMSAYLIEQIAQTENITVLGHTEITEATGDQHLQSISLHNRKSDERRTVPAGGVFIFIGAKPYTDWVPSSIVKDDKGFIRTGREVVLEENGKKKWKLKRDPYLLETSLPGVFAAGDVRSGAMNRVASAVGEGAMSISFVHKYLAEI
ncbi:FAD-dependent oxidoreductase [Cytophagales bacterium LB-30]|uniref:FAD-dependent oxidoreductase n=1 Tax=Shiella aurantiaca TaxID=3058365 RepID=A0ABT8F7I0_9BACT|nr:FAD-dependent oxidoreductase [Shiella aurantiaca]MDN4166432.1 FAD-dependent oxidoreductase [Shiella aurantiaca]